MNFSTQAVTDVCCLKENERQRLGRFLISNKECLCRHKQTIDSVLTMDYLGNDSVLRDVVENITLTERVLWIWVG